MNCGWTRIGAMGVLMGVLSASGQDVAVPTATEAARPILTLGTPMLKTTMEKLSLSWTFPEKMPDFRLKVERPPLGLISPMEMRDYVRGVEIRLPVEGLWVGYEKAADGEESRATFSIQRKF